MKKFYFIILCFFMLGITSISKAQFTKYTMSNSGIPSDYVVGGVVVDNNNNIWLGTDAGVAKFDGTNWTVFTTTDGLPTDIISCIAVDNNNNIWIGTDGDGVAKYNGTTWTKYAYSDGLCDNGIHYIACETNGTVWFGSWGGGVSKLNGSTWTTYLTELPTDGSAYASIFYIHIDASNNKWFGTDMGLVKYDNSSWTTLDQTTTPQLENTFIKCIAVDADNNKWLGVAGVGLTKLNSSNAFVETDSVGFCDKGINDIKFDSDGNIWTGEYTIYGSEIVGGITKFNKATSTAVSYAATYATLGQYKDQVFRIDIDNNDNIWIATGTGLYKFVDDTGIEEIYGNNLLDFYPNPANEYLTIKSDIHSGNAEISDITGRIVLSQAVSSPVKINIENLVNGIYFIKITEEGKTFKARFIKG